MPDPYYQPDFDDPREREHTVVARAVADIRFAPPQSLEAQLTAVNFWRERDGRPLLDEAGLVAIITDATGQYGRAPTDLATLPVSPALLPFLDALREAA